MCGKCSKPGQPSVLCKEGLRVALQDLTVNVSMICQVVIHSKAAIALNRYIMI